MQRRAGRNGKESKNKIKRIEKSNSKELQKIGKSKTYMEAYYCVLTNYKHYSAYNITHDII